MVTMLMCINGKMGPMIAGWREGYRTVQLDKPPYKDS